MEGEGEQGPAMQGEGLTQIEINLPLELELSYLYLIIYPETTVKSSPLVILRRHNLD